MAKKNLIHYFLRIEVLFVFLALVNIWPIWFSNYFPTLDGPSHLYNSQIIGNLWNSNSFFSQFVQLNREWVPNWTGHFLLAFIQGLGLSVFLANKIVLSCIALGIPLAFKSVLKEFGTPITGISFFSLVFVYTFLFGMGFYNFGLGILMVLLSIRSYTKSKKQPTWKVFTLLFLCLGLCFFSHLVCFGILCFYFLIDVILGWIQKPRSTKWSKVRVLFLLCFPFVVLSAAFFIGREAPDTDSYFGAATLLQLFTKMKILVLYFGKPEIWLAQLVFYILSFYLMVSAIRIRILKQKLTSPFFAFGFLLVLFFIMPDAGSNGSFISRRILIFAVLFLLMALSPVFNTKWINSLLIFLVIGIQGFRTNMYYSEIKEQEKQVEELLTISSLIENQSIVLDVWKGDGIKERHFSSYLGLDKELIILDNYEANYGYFPIKWKEDFPKINLFNSSLGNVNCLKWKSGEEATFSYTIDYVLLYGENPFSECEKAVFENIKANYQMIYSSANSNKTSGLSLYKSKK